MPKNLFLGGQKNWPIFSLGMYLQTNPTPPHADLTSPTMSSHFLLRWSLSIHYEQDESEFRFFCQAWKPSIWCALILDPLPTCFPNPKRQKQVSPTDEKGRRGVWWQMRWGSPWWGWCQATNRIQSKAAWSRPIHPQTYLLRPIIDFSQEFTIRSFFTCACVYDSLHPHICVHLDFRPIFIYMWENVQNGTE